MAEEESFDNLENLDWSDVESELKANKEKILSEVKNGNDTEQNKEKTDRAFPDSFFEVLFEYLVKSTF